MTYCCRNSISNLIRINLTLYLYFLFISQVAGTPANIVKPYTALDSSCPYHDVKTNSIYKYPPNTQSNDIDGEENSISDSEKIKVTRHSPTYSLELSSSSSRNVLSPLIFLLVILRISLQ